MPMGPQGYFSWDPRRTLQAPSTACSEELTSRKRTDFQTKYDTQSSYPKLTKVDLFASLRLPPDQAENGTSGHRIEQCGKSTDPQEQRTSPLILGGRIGGWRNTFFFFKYGRQGVNCEVGNGWRELKLRNVSEGCKIHQEGA